MKNPLTCLDYDGEPLKDVVKQVATGDVLLCGPEPDDPAMWAYSSDLGEQWQVAGARKGEDSASAVFLERTTDKAQVSIRWSEMWDDQDGAKVSDFWNYHLFRLHELLCRHFPSTALNFRSPVELGRHLMAACWHKDGMLTPPAPPEIRQLLKDTSPQGRHEILTLPDLETIPGLYEYDMRLAYLWCCKGLPYGEVERGTSWRDAPDKLRVVYAAPKEWQHIGLVPAKIEGKWAYPLGGTGWIDVREYALALRNGWEMYVGEALEWSQRGALDRWSDGIQAALRECEEGSLAYRIIRRVALQTIGSLHRTTTKRTRTLPYSRRAELPRSCPSLRMSDDSLWYSWEVEEPIRGRGQIYMHPEWTTTIWARCRARLAQAALKVPREQLIAIRQDALYTSHPQPWLEGKVGRIGDFRLKRHIPGPLPAPHTLEELSALTKEGK